MNEIISNYLEASLQAALAVALILFAYPLLTKRYSAKLRYAAWMVIALRLLVSFDIKLPFQVKRINVPLPLPVQASASFAPQPTVFAEEALVQAPILSAVPTGKLPVGAVPDTVKASLSLAAVLGIVWIAGSAVFLLIHAIAYIKFRKQAMKSAKEVPCETSLIIDRLSRELKLSRRVPAYTVALPISPMVLGFLRPVLLLPEDMAEPDELVYIIKHELIHLKRGDIYAKLVILIANAVHWFNPLIYIMKSKAYADIELACDERVIAGESMEARRAYSEALLGAICRRHMKAGVISTEFYGGKRVMKKRFKNILAGNVKRKGTAVFLAFVVLIVCLTTFVACGKRSYKQADMEALARKYFEAELGVESSDKISSNIIWNEKNQMYIIYLTYDGGSAGSCAYDQKVSRTYTVNQFGRGVDSEGYEAVWEQCRESGDWVNTLDKGNVDLTKKPKRDSRYNVISILAGNSIGDEEYENMVLINHIDVKARDRLPGVYGGCYVNDKGRIVIMLTDLDAKDKISDATCSRKAEYVKCDASIKDLGLILGMTTDFYSANYGCGSPEVDSMLEAMVSTSIDIPNNKVSVYFKENRKENKELFKKYVTNSELVDFPAVSMSYASAYSSDDIFKVSGMWQLKSGEGLDNIRIRTKIALGVNFYGSDETRKGVTSGDLIYNSALGRYEVKDSVSGEDIMNFTVDDLGVLHVVGSKAEYIRYSFDKLAGTWKKQSGEGLDTLQISNDGEYCGYDAQMKKNQRAYIYDLGDGKYDLVNYSGNSVSCFTLDDGILVSEDGSRYEKQ